MARHIKKVLEGAGFAEIWVNPDIVDLHTFIKISNRDFRISTYSHGKVS